MTAKHIGFDVSKWQRPELWHWPGLAAMSATIVARATYGTEPDETFPEYARLCREHGARLGAYHFFRQTQALGEQLNAFENALLTWLGPGDVLPVLDLEDNTQFDGPLKPRAFNADARRLAEWIRDEYGGCILYYSAFFPAALGNPKWLGEDGYRHWIADYDAPPGFPRAEWHWHQPRPEPTPLFNGGRSVVDHIYANPEHEPGVMLIGEMPGVCGVQS
ncbi:MAG: hypothetical protein KC492_34285 [Myxococcales bacterium]|nr:hypothetical protein [Myxococcales bacterium]